MLDYTLHGDSDRPSLVLLHAGGLTSREWDPFLEAWIPYFHLVTLTALAHGKSPNVPEITIPLMADSVLEVLDHVGIERAHFLGSSMGGATALWILRHRPERVDRLVLYRVSHRQRETDREAIGRLAEPENWRQWGLERWMSREHEPQGGPEAWHAVLRKVAAAFTVQQPQAALSPADLNAIEQPVLHICGDRDDLAPVEDAFEMYRSLPHGSLWIVPGAGHVMGMDTWRRPAFETEVLRFLRSA